MANDGKQAERSFVDYWERIGHVERLRDKRDLMGLNGGRNVADFKKPSDFLVSSPTHALHYAEVKSVQSGSSFPFKNIKEGQHKAAILETARGSSSFIFYIFSYELGRWYTMSCDQYTTLVNAGRKSVKFEELTPWR